MRSRGDHALRAHRGLCGEYQDLVGRLQLAVLAAERYDTPGHLTLCESASNFGFAAESAVTQRCQWARQLHIHQ